MLHNFITNKFGLFFASKYKNSLFRPVINIEPIVKIPPGKFTYTFIDNDSCCNVTSTRGESTNRLHQSNNYIAKVGNATWTLLHSMAETYPDKPNYTEKNEMNQFITLLAKYYPCEHCKVEFQDYVSKNKPLVNGRKDLVSWMCEFHNYINQKIGKNIVRCESI